MKHFPFLALLLLILTYCSPSATETTETNQSLNLDLDKPEDNLKAFLKVRASETGEDVVFWASGMVHAFIPGERDQPILGFEMFNIAKIVPIEGQENAFDFLSREIVIYSDPKTGEIIDEWKNPWTEETVEVMHVFNDPVNWKYQLEGRFGPWGVPYTKLPGTDKVVFNNDIFLYYPSPLPKAEYPKNSRSDMYEAGELFQFYASMDDINNPDLPTVPVDISWSRVSDFLPWMEMSDRPGYLVYHTRGNKIPNGYDGLPQHVKDFVAERSPEYATAPSEYTSPNETSWTYFKKKAAEKASE